MRGTGEVTQDFPLTDPTPISAAWFSVTNTSFVGLMLEHWAAILCAYQ